MKTLCCLFLFTCVLCNKNVVIAQKVTTEIDSMLNEVENAPNDSIKVGSLIKLDAIIRNQNFELHKSILTQIETICDSNLLKSDISFYQQKYFKSKLGWVNNAYGSLQFDLRNFDNALVHFNQAFKLFIETEDYQLVSLVLTNLGNVHRMLGQNELSKCKYLESAKAARNYGFYLQEARSYEKLAVLYQEIGLYDSAIFFFNKSLILLENETPKNRVSVQISMGSLFHETGENEKALVYYKMALNNLNEPQMSKTKSRIFNGMGLILKEEGQYSEAMALYEQTANYFLSTGNSFNAGYMHGNMSVVYDLLGDFNMASKYGQLALRAFEERADYGTMALITTNLGALFYRYGNMDSAMYYFEHSLTELKKVGDDKTIAFVKNNIGSVFLERGEIDTAIYLFNSTYLYYGSIGNPKLKGISMARLGEAYYKKENYDSAIFWLDSAQYVFLNSSSHYEYRNSMDEYILSLYKMNKKEQYIENLNKLLKMLFAEVENNFFTLSEYQKELYFSTMNNEFSLFYELAAENHLNDNLVQEVMNTALRAKGITLKSSVLMRTIIFESEDEVLINDYANWLNLKRKISESDFTNDTLVQKANAIEKNLVIRSSAFSDYSKIMSLNWQQVQSSLTVDEAAIEFIHFTSQLDSTHPVIYYALIVRPNNPKPQMVKLCSEQDLKNSLGVFQGNDLSFIERVYGKRTEAKKDLYEKIWQPLEPYLQNVKTVYYSPSGLLHKVSFAAICKDEDVYLSDVYNFRQMGSTGNLALENKTEFGELENFLLMGGVLYQRENEGESAELREVWSYLPGSLSETNSINTFLTKKKFGVNYFNGQNASEEIFKEKISSSSIVHIATHGFFFPDPEQVREEMKKESEKENQNEEIKFRGTTNYANWSFVNNKNPLMRSGIVLANANDVWNRDPLAEGEDGILTAQEVSNLDLRNTKLVVLSACETGLGDIKGSEGVYGLQRAFKMAGVKYLIMSLWQVPDKETSEFMILFYKNLIKIKDIPLAFQKTQKAMRAKYDPYYWGAFVLIE